MTHHDFEAGHGLVAVLVGESQHGLLGGVAIPGIQVIIDRHALPGSGRRIIEREIVNIVTRLTRAPLPLLVGYPKRLIRFFAVRLPDSHCESAVAGLAVVHESQVRFNFPREEEFVRWREEAQRSAFRLHDAEAVAGFQRHGVLVDVASEAVLLPGAGGIAPDDARVIPGGKTLQSGQVFVGHGLLLGLGDSFLAQQVGAVVDREAELSRKDAQFQAGEGNFQPRPVGFHLAGVGMVGGPGAADFLRLAG
jgi:hypothetical protein